MKKIFTLILTFIFSTGALMAQEEAPTAAPTATPLPGDGLGQRSSSESALNKAQAWVRDNDLKEGYNPDSEVYVSVAFSTIQNGVDGRLVAYETAMLQAKTALANAMAAVVRRDIESIVDRGNQENSQNTPTKDMSMTDKVRVLAHREMDALLEDHVASNPQDVDDIAKVYKELLLSKNFDDVINLAARAEVAGMRTLICFETMPEGRSGQIAVVASLSPSSRMMAATLLGEGYGVRNPKMKREDIGDWIRLQDEYLLYTHGVMQRYDEKGNLHLIAFGQKGTSRVNNEDLIELCYSESEVRARGALRSFVGEKMVAGARSAIKLETKTYAAAGNETEKEYESLSSYNEAMTGHAGDLKMPGVTRIHTAEYRHPVTKNVVVVSVIDWNLSTATHMNALAESFNDLGASLGGSGFTNVPKLEEDPFPAQKPKGGGSGDGHGASSGD